jgi:hypothetical protein
MKKKEVSLLFIVFALAAVSCEHDLSDTIFFYNFSSLMIQELTVSDFDARNTVYAYTNGIPPNAYHEFELPEGNYHFKVKTEDGGIYESKEIYHSAILPTDVILSVDYEIMDYD